MATKTVAIDEREHGGLPLLIPIGEIVFHG